jgi:GDPmannose 4,6-dehydratase
MKIAFITGITGQDGSYLAELLLEKGGYTIFGMIRRSSLFNTSRIDHISDQLKLRYGDVTDLCNITSILNEIKTLNPSIIEVYHLAAQSHVMVSFEMPIYTSNCDAIGTLNMLEGIRITNLQGITRFYNATTSELFGLVQQVPQTEVTPFYPRSPYGVAKLYSYWITKNYREAYDMYTVNGILFNHTSPRRGENFVERKISIGVAKYINSGTELRLGNLDSKRDLGCAKEYVHGMWVMLQQDVPDDYVLATGQMISIRDIVEMAFSLVDITIKWQGHGVDEIGINAQTGQVVVRVDSKYFRPAEVEQLQGDASKLYNKTGWKPIVQFKNVLEEMIKEDSASMINA